MIWNKGVVLENLYHWHVKIIRQQSPMSVTTMISTKRRTVAATSSVEQDWVVVIDASSCVIQLILITKNTTAGNPVQKHANVVIGVNVAATRSAINVWMRHSRLFPVANIVSPCPVIKIPPLFSVPSHVQRSFVVVMHVQINVENLAQENA
jgi:hypothetical protein